MIKERAGKLMARIAEVRHVTRSTGSAGGIPRLQVPVVARPGNQIFRSDPLSRHLRKERESRVRQQR